MNLILFTEFVKQAEEEKKHQDEEVSFGRKVLRAVPFVAGLGAGSVASAVLKEQIKKVKNPIAIKAIQFGVPAATAVGAHFLLPKIKKQIEDDIFKGKKHPEKKNDHHKNT